MKDFFKQELAIGDIVAFEEPGYRNLVLGEIIAFTPKNVRVAYGAPRSQGIRATFLTLPNSVVKKPVNVS
jgi:hypothetical protein